MLALVTARCVPTVLRSGPYRLFFYSGDRPEPPHVPVERGQMVAKFWLKPVRLAQNGGFGRPELASLQRLVTEHADLVQEAWDAYFGA